MTVTQRQAAQAQQGQITAAMRSLRIGQGPRILRVGVVHNGRMVEERVIKQRTHVTVGTSEKNLFVVSGKGLPASFRLFEKVDAGKGHVGYRLNCVTGMTGRLAMREGVRSLEQLASTARDRRGTMFSVPLTDQTRGKLTLGDTTILFQFVEPPPPGHRPQLPMSVQTGLNTDIDWRFTIIAAFSFLFHFGAVGMLYSDWMDPVVSDRNVTLAGLIDSVKNIPPPPPLETPEVVTDANATATETTGTGKGSGKGKGGGGRGGGGKGSGGLSSSEFAGLSRSLDQLEMATLGALTGTGTATAGVLGSGEVPTGALEAAAASGAGVGLSGGSGLNIGGGGGGAIRPGASGGGGGLAAIGQTGGGEVATAGTATKVSGPKGTVNASASVAVGTVSNANAVVARMSAGFRRCYNQGLASNPDMSGRVNVSARIGPGGEVQSVTATPSGTISSDVANCIAARVRSARFDPPEGGAATINIPVTLVQQKSK